MTLRNILSILLIFSGTLAYSQVPCGTGDGLDPCTAVELTIGSDCSSPQQFRTNSCGNFISPTSCNGQTKNDVWGTFTTGSLTNITIVHNSSNRDMILHLYTLEGDCSDSDNLVEVACADDNIGTGDETLNAELNQYTTYYIRCQAKGADGLQGNGICVYAEGYCDVAGDNSAVGYISGIEFNDISQSSGWDSGYGDYTAVSTDVEKTASYDLTLTRYASSSYVIYTAAWIDWNGDGYFTGEDEYVMEADFNVQTGDLDRVENITVPADAITGTTRMRCLAMYSSPTALDPPDSDGCDNTTSPCCYFEYEDYTINILAPVAMAYSSSTTTQTETSSIGQGIVNGEIIGIQIETTGQYSPLDVTSMTFSTNGTTTASDIVNAKIFYSGSDPEFSTAVQKGSTSISPSGSFTINDFSQTLNTGVNYFWLAYDIDESATNGNLIDAECTSITVGGTPYAPSVTAPSGSRSVDAPAYCSVSGSSTLFYISNASFNTIDRTSTYDGGGYFYDGTSTDIEQGLSYDLDLTVYNAGTYNLYTAGWIDWNNDYDFDDEGENVIVSAISSTGTGDNSTPRTVTITVPQDAEIGTVRMRLAVKFGSHFDGPCDSYTGFIEWEDYDLNIEAGAVMTYVSSTVTQTNTDDISQGSLGEILGIEIVTGGGGLSPLSASSFTFSTTGSTDASDINQAKVYYTGSSSSFEATEQFGSIVFSPDGTFVISGSQELLGNTTNYFWLAYQINSDAVATDVVDAQCTSLNVDGSRIPSVTNPSGSRTIIASSPGTYCASSFTNTTDDWITNVSFNEIDNTSGQDGSSSYGDYTAQSTTVTQGQSYDLSVTFESCSPTCYTQNISAWFDWNGDGDFEDDGEEYQLGSGQSETFETSIEIPVDTYIGDIRLRVIEQYNAYADPCDSHSTTYGETEDYTVTIDAVEPMTYSSSSVSQNNTDNIEVSSVNNEIIGIQILTTGSYSPLSVSEFTFDTDGGNGTGSDNPSTNVAGAKVYYTGSSSTFSTSNLFGTVTGISGSFDISGSQDLVEGNNYFWLAYSVSSDAVVGEDLDASLTSFIVGGVEKSDMSNAEPAGKRTIEDGDIYYSRSDGDWTTSDIWSNSEGGASCSCQPNGSGVVVVAHDINLDVDRTVDALQIEDGSSLSGSGALTVSGNMEVEGSGYFDLSNQLTVNGDVSIAGTGTSSNSSINDLNGNCTIGNGSTLSLSALGTGITVGGNLIVNGTLSSGVSNIVLDGGTTSISGSGTISGSSDVIVNAGNKTVLSGTSLSIGPEFVIQGAYTVTNNGIVTLTKDLTGSVSSSTWLNSTGSTLYAGSSVLSTGTLTASANNNTIRYNSATSQSIKNATYYNLILENSGKKTLLGNIDINGDLTISSCEFDVSGSNYNINIAGDWTNTGTFTARNGKVVFDGSSEMDASALQTFYELEVSGSGLTILADNTITINGNTTNNSSITLKCASSSNPATSWIDNGTVNGSGTFNVERYLPTANRYWYTSPPVSGTTSADFDAENADHRVYTYDEPTTWVAVSDNSTSLVVGQGYAFKDYSSAEMLTYSGTVTTGTVNKTITYNTSGSMWGYNLVGNPYPSAVDWDASSGWTKTNIRDVVYINNGTNWTTYNGTSHIGTNGGTQYIPAMQGFWIKSLGSDGTLEFTNGVRVHNAATFKGTKSVSDILRLKIDNGSSEDESVLFFHALATDGAENLDTDKSFGSPVTPHLYFEESGGKQLAVNSLSSSKLSADVEVPLGIKVNSAGTYTITASDLGSFSGKYIYLEDVDLGTFTNLNDNPSYIFTTSGAENRTTRFTIHIKDNPLPVELLSFEGALVDGEVILTWATASEKDNDYFEIQKSVDGYRFVEIDLVSGSGSSNEVVEYESVDYSPSLGTNYYRLKQVDYDGQYEYSKVISLSNYTDLTVDVYPNPASDYLFVNIPSVDQIEVGLRIISIDGKVVLEQIWHDDSGIKRLNISDLPAAQYILQKKINNELFEEAIIIE
jgi:hypothetical protein